MFIHRIPQRKGLGAASRHYTDITAVQRELAKQGLFRQQEAPCAGAFQEMFMCQLVSIRIE